MGPVMKRPSSLPMSKKRCEQSVIRHELAIDMVAAKLIEVEHPVFRA